MYGLSIEALDREFVKSVRRSSILGMFLSNVESVQVSASSLSLYILDWCGDAIQSVLIIRRIGVMRWRRSCRRGGCRNSVLEIILYGVRTSNLLSFILC